ncbi:hypothetical protein IID04_05140 [PVC group bacterium]|nr:hypothetical protein [PVC group bacterium]
MKKIMTIFVFAAVMSASHLLYADELVLADFEGWPNNLGGEMGVYGSLEPDWENTSIPYSWIYDSEVKDQEGFDRAYVHSGGASFRLVNGTGAKPSSNWGSFAMDLGVTTDLTVEPKIVESRDVSSYGYFTFWIKGQNGGESAEILFRDAHAVSYMPQMKVSVSNITAEWQQFAIPLDQVNKKIDLSQLDNVGMAFGPDVGNATGAIIYVDDFTFMDSADGATVVDVSSTTTL